MKTEQMIATVITGILAMIALGGIASYFIMLLWNGCLVPAVSVVNPIGWLQAWGLSILCGLLFKSTSVKTSK